VVESRKILQAYTGGTTRMMRTRLLILVRSGAFVGLLALAEFAAGQAPGRAQENKWGFGTDVGFLSGSVNGTVFALQFHADYYLDRAFSVGPMFLLTPVGDLTQIGIAGVARYHFRTAAVNVVPFAGLGLVHADLDRGSGPGRIDKNDTSHYIPIGVTLERQATPSLALASTLMFNLHDLNLDLPSGRDTLDIAVLFGFRFGP
jgi:hypothetical protein